MNVIFYLGFGIITHLIAWGGGWYGMNSLALVVFWPFCLLWWLILFIGYYIIPIVVIVVAVAIIYDRISVHRKFKRMVEFRNKVKSQQ